MGIGIAVALVLLVILAKNQKWFKSSGVGAGLAGLRDPRIMITIGLAIFNLVVWAMIPWLWGVIAYTWYTFTIFNIGFWAVLYLRTVKTKDASGKETKETDPVASKLASIITAILILGLTTTAWLKTKDWWGKREAAVSKSVMNLSHGAPAEIAIPIICGCESTGIPGVIQHYEEDGETPLKNRPKPGKQPTSAIGACGIMASLHEEEAKKLGYDIRTPEGNVGYAEVLYRESGTKHWQADPDSVACWEPKLRAYTWGGKEVVLRWPTPVGDWSNLVVLPRNGGQHSIDAFGKKYSVLWNPGRDDQTEEDLPRPAGVPKKKPVVVYDFKLKSREKDDILVTIKFF